MFGSQAMKHLICELCRKSSGLDIFVLNTTWGQNCQMSCSDECAIAQLTIKERIANIDQGTFLTNHLRKILTFAQT